MTEFCKDCQHVCCKTIQQHTCKLNFVRRNALDGCCWDTKQYPSKFEYRTRENPPKDIIEELERYLIWQGGLVDDIDKRDGELPSDIVLNKIAELKNKWVWY